MAKEHSTSTSGLCGTNKASTNSGAGCLAFYQLFRPAKAPTVADTTVADAPVAEVEEVVEEWWSCNPQKNYATRLRPGPRFGNQLAQGSLSPGEVFFVSARLRDARGVTWLKLANGQGWIPDSLPGGREAGAPDVCIRSQDPAKLRESGEGLVQVQAEKQITLGRSLMREENRGVACTFVAFAIALAVIPVIGLLMCEYALRDYVLDPSTRWTYGGAFAVVLVNVVMASYAVMAAFESTPSQNEQSKSTPVDVGSGKKER